MSEYVPLRQLIQFAIGGGWGSDDEEAGSERVGVIRGADFPAVIRGDVRGLPRRYEGTDRAQARLLRDGDIVLEISGGTKDRPTGRTVYVSEGLLARSDVPLIPASFCRLVRVDSHRAVPRYVYYWLQGMYTAGRAWSYQNRSTGISNFQFEYFLDAEKVRLPALGKQTAIAEVLGALDDAIEANHLLSRDLEARIGYRYQELANAVSDDWRTMPVGDAVAVRGGGTPATGDARYWDGGRHSWVTPRDLSRLEGPVLLGTERTVTDAGLARISSGLLPVGTVLLSSRAPIGYLALAELPVAVNQGFIAMICEGRLPNFYVWQWAVANMEAIKARANGSTFQEISKSNFRPMLIPVPPTAELTAFTAFVEPLYRLMVAKVRESERLAALRDALLLPAVLGEVGIDETTAEVEAAV